MMLESVLSYLKQPSTYQGLATIAAACGYAAFPAHMPIIITALGIVVGLIQAGKNDDPNKALLKQKQFMAKARQMGYELTPINKDKE